MNKLLFLLALALPVFSQGTPAAPDCPLQQGLFSAAGDIQLDNRALQCDSWTLAYVADATLSFTLTFQSQNNQTAPVAANWVTYTGNKSNSSSSFGTASTGIETLCGLATCVPSGGVTVETSWVRAHLSGVSGAGFIRVFFYGYRTGNATGLQGGGGSGGTACPNPCPVEGTAAAGSPPSGPPVQIGGSDGTNMEVLSTDTSGRPKVIGAAASGSAVAGNPVLIGGTDGTDARSVSTDASGNVNVNVKSNVQPAGLATFTSGQQAVTGTAANLGTNTAKSVCVHALIGNTINVYAGASGVTTSTGMEIPPGLAYCWNVANTNQIFVIASTTGASVSWTLTN